MSRRVSKWDRMRLRLAMSCAFLIFCTTMLADDRGALEGQLRLAADTPVQLAGGGTPAADYARFFVVIRSADGATEIARAHPDSSGSYRFSLPPGDYLVAVEQPAAKTPPNAPQKFTVAPNKSTRVDTHVAPDLRKSAAGHLGPD